MKIVQAIDWHRPTFVKTHHWEMRWHPRVLFYPESEFQNFTVSELKEIVREMEKMEWAND